MPQNIKSGLINLNKPSGMTSRRAVDMVGRIAGRKTKIGHAGTLDPLAEGVLVLCLGSATRLIEYVQQSKKRYTGTFLLGRQSPTEDTDGEVAELADPPIPTLEEIQNASSALVGEIQQRPPAFSALKVNGRRAYDLARSGKPPVLKPRVVRVYGLSVAAYRYPELTLEVECGAGTYIRSLGRDLAESLGTAAVMSKLTRTAVGRFTLEDAVNPQDLSRESLSKHILTPAAAVQSLPKIDLTFEDLEEIRHGRTIPYGKNRSPEDPKNLAQTKQFAGFAPDGRLVSILVPRGNAHLCPLRNFFD